MIKAESILVWEIIPQRIKTVFMKQNKDYTAEILIVSALVVAAMLVHFTANQFNHWFLKMNSMVPGADNDNVRLFIQSTGTAFGCLLVAGFIHGRLNRNR